MPITLTTDVTYDRPFVVEFYVSRCKKWVKVPGWTPITKESDYKGTFRILEG